MKITTTGNKGEKIRSDCFVTFEQTDSGGVALDIKSKVGALYGKSIKELIFSVLHFFDIKNAKLTLEDQGALPHVIAARIEAAVKLAINTDKDYIFPILPQNQYTTEFDRLRFSRLYLPGNTPSMMINAGIHKPDGIILDLEDSVAPDKKFEAGYLVRNMLRQTDFYGSERMVRINKGEDGLKDLSLVVPSNVNLLLLPKCEDETEIYEIENEISKIKEKHNLKNPIWLMPIIESAEGIENAYKIAKASPDIVAMAIGLEDFTADMGVKRTKEGKESLYARTRLVNACKAAGIQAIDSVFSDVGDTVGLQENIKISKSLGFDGMGCIHPRQIKLIRDGYLPDTTEIEKAMKIAEAYKTAKANGLGVVALGTKMIDAPVVKRAMNTLKIAENAGLIDNFSLNFDSIL